MDSTGVLTIKGLSEGDYEIEELIAPTGYNLLTDKVNVKIDYTYAEATNKVTWSVKSGSTEGVTYDTANKAFKVDIKNNSGTALPETGGIGTTIFYIVGAILVLFAGVVLVTRRRMSAE